MNINSKSPNSNATTLIVGAGPTGLTLACELFRRGISCRIIEKRKKPSTHSKALGVSATSLMIFNRFGIADALIKDGIQMKDTYFYWKGKKFYHTNYRYLKGCRYPFMLLAHQTMTEKHLLKALLKFGGKVEYGVELTNLSQEKDQVNVVLKHSNDQLECACYEEVIGCDGSQSKVRQELGMDFYGKDYGLHFIYGDFELEGFQGDKTAAHYFLDDSNLLIMLPSPNEIYRIVGLVPGEKDKRPLPTLYDLQQYLDRFGPGGITLKNTTQLGSVPIYYRITNEVQVGRVFLAGDAFHLFSPIGGQGMNSGIQDAYNLAWKLAYVKQGRAKRMLLNTYKEERLPLVNEVIQNVINSVNLIVRHDKENDSIVQSIAPLMSNRQFFKNTLPKNYSGFNYKYAESGFVINDLLDAKVKPIAGEYSLHYDVLHTLTDFMLIVSDQKELMIYKAIIDKYDFIKMVIDKTLKKYELQFVRPDGYIAYRSDTNNLTAFKRYLSSYFEKDLANAA